MILSSCQRIVLLAKYLVSELVCQRNFQEAFEPRPAMLHCFAAAWPYTYVPRGSISYVHEMTTFLAIE